MTRITRAWGALAPEQRIAAVASVALLVTMFLPWYELQSLDRKSGAINSHSISAFGDVSFVEAAVFLVAAGVIALLFARAERKDFHMPGSDGAIVMIAGGWATLLIFYRVFSRPAGHGYPVGIQWGFFLAFVAAGALTYAGWRMRATSTPEAPLLRTRTRARRPFPEDLTTTAGDITTRLATGEDITTHPAPRQDVTDAAEDITVVTPSRERREPPASPPAATPASPTVRAGSRGSAASKRSRFPPPPSDQLSFEDHAPERDEGES